MSKYGVFSGPYFPGLGLYGPEKSPYLDTFEGMWMDEWINDFELF